MVNRIAEGNYTPKGAVLSYPVSLNFFENRYSHIHGVKWSPRRVYFEIDYLRGGGGQIFSYPSLRYFFLFSLNLTLY